MPYEVYTLRTADGSAWFTYFRLHFRLTFCAAEAANKIEFVVNLMAKKKNLDRRTLRKILLSGITKNKINDEKIPKIYSRSTFITATRVPV